MYVHEQAVSLTDHHSGKEAKDEAECCPEDGSENAQRTNGHNLDTVKQNPELDKLSLKTRKAPVSLGVSMVGAPVNILVSQDIMTVAPQMS